MKKKEFQSSEVFINWLKRSHEKKKVFFVTSSRTPFAKMMLQEKKKNIALLKKTVPYVFREEFRIIQENSIASEKNSVVIFKKKKICRICSKTNAKGRLYFSFYLTIKHKRVLIVSPLLYRLRLHFNKANSSVGWYKRTSGSFDPESPHY